MNVQAVAAGSHLKAAAGRCAGSSPLPCSSDWGATVSAAASSSETRSAGRRTAEIAFEVAGDERAILHLRLELVVYLHGSVGVLLILGDTRGVSQRENREALEAALG